MSTSDKVLIAILVAITGTVLGLYLTKDISKDRKLGVDYNTTNAFIGDMDVTGKITAGSLGVLDNTKTTVSVGGLNNIGCIAIGSSGSTTTINYITANGTTLSTTTTKPVGCN